MMSKAYPYPEIVTGEAWTVHGTPDNELGGSTDNLNKKMTVPLNRECEYCGVNHARQVRRHELGHAKWSPKTMGKLLRGTRAEAIHAFWLAFSNRHQIKKGDLNCYDKRFPL